MSSPEYLIETKRWLRYAWEDLETGEHLLKEQDFIPRHVCWLSEQAIEKALKAILVFLQIDFPRSHDLDGLRNLIPSGWQVKTDYPDLAELTEWAVESRYPGDWPDASREDAFSALKQAQQVWKTIMDDFSRHDFNAENSFE